MQTIQQSMMIQSPSFSRKPLGLRVDTPTAFNEEVLIPKPVILTSPLKAKTASQLWPSRMEGVASPAKKSLFGGKQKVLPRPSTPTAFNKPSASSPQIHVQSPVQHRFQSASSSPVNSPITAGSASSLEYEAGLEIQHILQGGVENQGKEGSQQQSQQLNVNSPFDVLFDYELEQNENQMVIERTAAPAAFGFDDDDEEMDLPRYQNRPALRSNHQFNNQIEDDDNDHHHLFAFGIGQDMTPPVRADNPIYMDARFYNDMHCAMSPSEQDGAELGIFNFSPPRLCSSH